MSMTSLLLLCLFLLLPLRAVAGEHLENVLAQLHDDGAQEAHARADAVTYGTLMGTIAAEERAAVPA